MEYDAFGNLISHSGTTPNAYLYRGERYDADLGLYYLRARWYNPVTGRFMTRDPYQGSIYDPASLHRYNYARANPVNFVDPSGRFAAGEYRAATLNSMKKPLRGDHGWVPDYPFQPYQLPVLRHRVVGPASSLAAYPGQLQVDGLWTRCSASSDDQPTRRTFGEGLLINSSPLPSASGVVSVHSENGRSAPN